MAPRFPSAELVQHAADLLPHIAGGPVGPDAEISEGPRREIVVSPGVIRVRTRDYARAERRHERGGGAAPQEHRHGDHLGGRRAEPLPTRGTITGWTRPPRTVPQRPGLICVKRRHRLRFPARYYLPQLPGLTRLSLAEQATSDQRVRREGESASRSGRRVQGGALGVSSRRLTQLAEEVERTLSTHDRLCHPV